MKHLKKNNETYLSHLLFASKIGLILIFHGIVFLLHAVFPICNVPKKWNFEGISIKLYRWNEHTKKRKNK